MVTARCFIFPKALMQNDVIHNHSQMMSSKMKKNPCKNNLFPKATFLYTAKREKKAFC